MSEDDQNFSSSVAAQDEESGEADGGVDEGERRLESAEE